MALKKASSFPRKKASYFRDCWSWGDQINDGYGPSVRIAKRRYWESLGDGWIKRWEEHYGDNPKRALRITKAERKPGYFKRKGWNGYWNGRVTRSSDRGKKKYELEKWGAVGEESKVRKRRKTKKWI